MKFTSSAHFTLNFRAQEPGTLNNRFISIILLGCMQEVF